jgi:hypothetical protein
MSADFVTLQQPRAADSEIEQRGYRAYTAEDLEGRRWTFLQARPTMRLSQIRDASRGARPDRLPVNSH